MTLEPDIRSRDRGHPAAEYRITRGGKNGRLGPGDTFNNIRQSLPYDVPSEETYYVHVYTSQDPDEDIVLDSHTFPNTITIGRRGGSGWSSDDDHGSKRGQATPVGTSSNTRGNLERRGDVDYFRVEVPAGGGQLRIATSGSTDTVGYLQRAQGEYLAGNDNVPTSTDRNFRIERNVTRGIYYIAVTGAASRTATGTYNLHVGFTASGGRPDDHGNRREDATRVGLETATRGALEQRGDVDYFRITIDRTGQLRVATSGRSTDTDGNLQDARRVLARNDNAGEGNNFRIVRQVTRGTYYVAVYGGNGRTATGSYTLHVGFTPGGGGPAPSDDHGNRREDATRVGPGTATRGALEQRGDVDYFRVDVPATGELRVATSGNTDTFGYLGGTSGGWLGQNDDNRGNLNFRIVRRVSRGTYYVAVVGGEGRTATGEYTLHVNFSRQ